MEADRPVQVEVTPAMIEAGRCALKESSLDLELTEEGELERIAVSVFEAMERARRPMRKEFDV